VLGPTTAPILCGQWMMACCWPSCWSTWVHSAIRVALNLWCVAGMLMNPGVVPAIKTHSRGWDSSSSSQFLFHYNCLKSRQFIFQLFEYIPEQKIPAVS